MEMLVVKMSNRKKSPTRYENHEPKNLFTVFGIYQGLVFTKNVKFKANELFWNVAG